MYIFLNDGSDRSIGGGYEACHEGQYKVAMLRSHISVSERPITRFAGRMGRLQGSRGRVSYEQVDQSDVGH